MDEATIAQTIKDHQPSTWRSFSNGNTIYRCCGKDFGNSTRKPRAGDILEAWGAWAEHLAEIIANGSNANADVRGSVRTREGVERG